jgi:hypothetical protein
VSVIELRGHFDPSQPRDSHGRWAHTPSYGAERAWEAGAGQRQRASGLWGGKTYAQHSAAVSRLNPDQLGEYNDQQTHGVSPGDALARAQMLIGKDPSGAFAAKVNKVYAAAAGAGKAADVRALSRGQRMEYVRQTARGTSHADAMKAARAYTSPWETNSPASRLAMKQTMDSASLHTAQRAPLLPGEQNARNAAAAHLRRTNVFTAGPHAAFAAKAKTPTLLKLKAKFDSGQIKDPVMARAVQAELKLRGELAGASTIQAANPAGGIELGWRDAWRTEHRGRGGMWQGIAGSMARDMLAGAAQNPDNAAAMRDIAGTVSGMADAQLGQQLGMKVPKGAADIISNVRPENAVAAVQKLTKMGMKQLDAAKAVTAMLNRTPGAVTRTQALIAGSRTVQTANEMATPTSTAGRKAAYKAGNALRPAGPGQAPGFPVTSGAQWEKARQAVGRVADPARRASLAKLLRKTAPKFGKTKALAQSWAAPGGAKTMTADHGRTLDMAIRQPVRTPFDVVVARGDDGAAIIRHRQGGGLIGRMYRDDAGQWVGVGDGGKKTDPRNHQRTTLLDLITAYNGTATAALTRPSTPPLPAAQPAVQTDLMQQFGVPAIKLATPSTSSTDGPRTVTSGASDSDSDDGPAGLSPKGVAIYKKLKAKGFPAARALAFARRAQSFGGSK